MIYIRRLHLTVKITIALEELQVPHTCIMSICQQVSSTAKISALNPNGRIPVIIDRDEDNFVVFGSGAILLYLAEKTKLMPMIQKAEVLLCNG